MYVQSIREITSAETFFYNRSHTLLENGKTLSIYQIVAKLSIQSLYDNGLFIAKLFKKGQKICGIGLLFYQLFCN